MMYQLRNTELRTAQPCLPTNQSATQRLSARFLINNVHKQMNNKFKIKSEFTYLNKQSKYIWDNSLFITVNKEFKLIPLKN